MPVYGHEEIDNLTKVIESGWSCDKPDGSMDQFRREVAAALGTRHAIAGATAILLTYAIPGAIGAARGDEIICGLVARTGLKG